MKDLVAHSESMYWGSTGGLRKTKKFSGVISSSKAATVVEDFTGRPKLVAHHLPPAGVGYNQDEPTYGTVPLPNHLQRNKAHIERKDDENLLNIMAYDPNTFSPFCPVSYWRDPAFPKPNHLSSSEAKQKRDEARPKQTASELDTPDKRRPMSRSEDRPLPKFRGYHMKVVPKDPHKGAYPTLPEEMAQSKGFKQKLMERMDPLWSTTKSLFDPEETGMKRAATSHGYRLYMKRKTDDEIDETKYRVIEPYSEKNLFLKDKPKRAVMGERTWVPTKTDRLPERLYTPLRNMRGTTSWKYGNAKDWFTGKCAMLAKTLPSGFGTSKAQQHTAHWTVNNKEAKHWNNWTQTSSMKTIKPIDTRQNYLTTGYRKPGAMDRLGLTYTSVHSYLPVQPNVFQRNQL
eukprot:CAMPEP_0198199110 /NCGR_PEP_ID=MMETSP1445-20131203/2439_1 /TAXON_ID=36898 /ORGANISM="Pyramimonas sp., Strain CCMP2087" /LENGTH=400 /DNA_ID=CAMNT_0043868849 /DNA_START=157 /DNA_END=1359 /DNA_ORIENTATION=+